MAVGGVLSSNKRTRNWGAGLLLLGLGLKFLAERNNDSDKV